MQTSQMSSARPYRLEDWQGGNQALKEEFDYPITEIDGEIPVGLQGTLFRNIPAMLDVNGQEVHHPFDADGMIGKITLANQQAYFQNRYVRTPGYCEEQAQGKITYRGVFGTEKSGGWWDNAFDLRLKNVANTNVYYWGGKLLALWEASHPFRLDPETLATLGPETLDGAIAEGTPFAAHPLIEPGQNGRGPRYVTFGIQTFGVITKLRIYELNAAAQVVKHHDHWLPGFAFMHDFTITPHYCIFFQNPVSLNPLPYLLGRRGPAECMTFQKQEQTKIWLISRHDPQQVQKVETPSGFVFHHANAFEDGGEVVIDSVAYRDFPSINHQLSFKEVDFDEVPASQLWRYRINLKTGVVNRQQLENRACDFPYVNPARLGQQHRWIYLAATRQPTGNAPNQAILKINPDTQAQQVWSAAPTDFVGEPVFVARPGAKREDDGWLLVVVYDADRDRSKLVILAARDLEAGPVATLYLKHHLPYGLHGSFTPEVWLPSTAPAGAAHHAV